MAKEGAKISKVCGKKKVNRYTKADCVAELARLENDSSEYKKEVQERLARVS